MARDAQQGEDEWSHLGWKRDCEASQGRCWLCDALEDWNDALISDSICFSEPLPGKICIAIGDRVTYKFFEPGLISPEVTNIIRWLVSKHRCIKALEVGIATQLSINRSDPLENVAVQDSAAEPTCSLRHISIGCKTPPNWYSLLGNIGPIKELESLAVSDMLNFDSAKTLVALLTANAVSLRKVNMRMVHPDYCCLLMQAIAGCQNLTELEFIPQLGGDGLRSLAHFLQSNTTLRTLRAGMLELNQEVEESFRQFMSRNTTLRELDFNNISNVMSAVEDYDILEHLTTRILTTEGPEKLKSLLLKSGRLRSLKIGASNICPWTGKLIAEGLSSNTTIECLDVSECTTSIETVRVLCDALTPENRCSLKFGDETDHSPLQREDLARTLTERDLYARVRLKWTDCDASGLCDLLQRREPERQIDLELDAAKLSTENFQSLCGALSSSSLVRSLTVHSTNNGTRGSKSLSDALKRNSSLKSVYLVEKRLGVGFSWTAAQGLRSNNSVTHLRIQCQSMKLDGAKGLKSVIAGCQSLNGIDLILEDPLETDCVNIFCEGVTENPRITTFGIFDNGGANTSKLHAAIARNNTRLNRAVCFVLEQSTESTCAEAFELFNAQPSLIARVKEASGKSDEEAAEAVRAARALIANN